MYIYTATFMEINIFRTLQGPAAATKRFSEKRKFVKSRETPIENYKSAQKSLKKEMFYLQRSMFFVKLQPQPVKLSKKKK